MALLVGEFIGTFMDSLDQLLEALHNCGTDHRRLSPLKIRFKSLIMTGSKAQNRPEKLPTAKTANKFWSKLVMSRTLVDGSQRFFPGSLREHMVVIHLKNSMIYPEITET